MGQLNVSCDQAVKFLKDHKFKFVKNLKSFDFSVDNTIKFKVKVSIFRPPVKIILKSFKNGTLFIEADTKEFLEFIGGIFGLKRGIDDLLKDEGLAPYIQREKDLHFKILVNKFLETVIKGLEVKDIQLKNKHLLVDF